jgi:hypothetical protein
LLPRFASLSLGMLLAGGMLASGDQLPMEPIHDSGQGVTGAFEGWFKNSDGSFSILVGYFNRNVKEELEIPVGPNNRIEPGGPDRGQPTHFMPRRQWGVFVVKVPKDSPPTTRLTWTLTVHGKTNAIPIDINPLWEISPFSEIGMNNTPPIVTVADTSVQGPIALGPTLSATVATPLEINLTVGDDAKTFPNAKPPKIPPVLLTLSKFRGPGTVTFSKDKPPVTKIEPSGPNPPVFNGKATTTATFSEPGEYELLVMANDWSGDGGRGFQCCWTTSHIKVSVK